MQKMEFVRVLLVEKGVKPQLTNPYFYLWWKLLRIEAKPRVFESPFKLLFLQAIFGSVFWGGFMWLLFWQFEGFTTFQVYCSLFFGLFTGSCSALEVARARRKFGLSTLERWLEQNKLTEN
ncbi:DUF6404 family protein [Vibrio cyclitrophicus]|uniref:DUF6404 family protein n=1 Tax=Vibrio cyclitrophicus TaxID=47951 RepID=UPI0011B377D2|nr:DUF6404 family protein [Vibrio cyclitrophicus]